MDKEWTLFFVAKSEGYPEMLLVISVFQLISTQKRKWFLQPLHLYKVRSSPKYNSSLNKILKMLISYIDNPTDTYQYSFGPDISKTGATYLVTLKKLPHFLNNLRTFVMLELACKNLSLQPGLWNIFTEVTGSVHSFNVGYIHHWQILVLCCILLFLVS